MPVDLSGGQPTPLVISAGADGSFDAVGSVTADRGSSVQVSCTALNAVTFSNGADVKVIVTRDGSDWKSYSLDKGTSETLIKSITVK